MHIFYLLIIAFLGVTSEMGHEMDTHSINKIPDEYDQPSSFIER